MIAWLVLLQASLTIAVAGPATSPEYLPLHLAQAEGLFTAQKLSVTLRTYRSEPSAAEALAVGHAQFAATSLDSALRLGAVEGRPPRLVWGFTAAPPVALLVNPARKDSIRSPADLVGQTVAVPAPGTPEDHALAFLLARAGVAPQQVLLRSLGERGAARALEGGQVPAAVLGEPYVTRLVEDGSAVIAVDLRTARDAATWLGGPSVSAGLFARAGAELDEPTRRGLTAALQAALARVLSTDPAALAAGLPATTVGSPADFALRLARARDLFLPGGRVSVEALEHGVELVRSRGPLPATVKLPSAERLLMQEPATGERR
jgi:ABC-type nitrate/sulfonate/bicarbonate transport system substrate-binding protein